MTDYSSVEGEGQTKSVVLGTTLTLLLASMIMPALNVQSIKMSIAASQANFATPAIQSLLEGELDVYTQYPAPYGGQGQGNPSDLFSPQKEVKLTADVTYNALPVKQKQVDFEILDPHWQLWWQTSNVTDDNGRTQVECELPLPSSNPESVFGVWHVSATTIINSTTVNDTLAFHYDYQCRLFNATVTPPLSGYDLNFAHGDVVTLTIRYGTHSQRLCPAVFSMVIYDELSTPIALALAPRFVGNAVFPEYNNDTVMFSVRIPKFAFAGTATFYINVLDKDPKAGGVPYCPEYTPRPTIFITPTSTYAIIVPDNYTSIQQAINRATYGATIYVREGVYCGSIVVNKTLSLIGDNPTRTVVDGGGSGNVITVKAGSVVIKGFKITRSGSGNAGVFVQSYNKLRLEGNTIANNSYGIWLKSCSGTFVFNNNFVNNTHQFYVLSSTATWDNGYPSGGNHWSGYGGTDLFSGPYQNVSGSDGIGDSPYIIDGQNRDRYPLMMPCAPIDITVANVTPASNFVSPGKVLPVNVTVVCQGYKNETVHVALYAKGITLLNNALYLAASQTINMSGNSTSVVTFSWDTELFPLGNYTIYALTLPIGDEADAIDNWLVDGTIEVEPQHDVALTGIVANQGVCQGYCVNITVRVVNHGDFVETFNVTAYYNGTVIVLQDGKNYTTITLPKDGSAAITFVWNTIGVMRGNYSLSAAVSVVPDEKNVADNSLVQGWIMVSMVGDITGPDSWPDGKCDIRDVGFVGRHFGQYAPPAPLNCGITNDGKIDIGDIGIVARHYGEKIP